MDNRYKFIRARSPFQSLVDYATSEEVPMINKNIKYPLQMTFFNGGYEKLSKGKSLRQKEGSFFELISQGIYGGIVKKPNELKNNTGCLKSEPDITSNDHSKLKEIKAVYKNQCLKLNDDQIAKYYFIKSEGLGGKFPEIRYNIYRHGVKGLEVNFLGKSIDKLVFSLTESIRSMVSLPFRVIFEAYLNETSLTSRYEGDKWTNCTRINSSSLNKLLAKPVQFIEELNLSPNDFIFEKRKFPKKALMNGKEIKSFPVLIIKDQKNFSDFNYSDRLDKLDKSGFKNFFETLYHLTGKKTTEQIEAETKISKEIDSLFGEIPENDLPF
jgi:hypothetical protein